MYVMPTTDDGVGIPILAIHSVWYGCLLIFLRALVKLFPVFWLQEVAQTVCIHILGILVIIFLPYLYVGRTPR
jgi:hypothetical protein